MERCEQSVGLRKVELYASQVDASAQDVAGAGASIGGELCADKIAQSKGVWIGHHCVRERLQEGERVGAGARNDNVTRGGQRQRVVGKEGGQRKERFARKASFEEMPSCTAAVAHGLCVYNACGEEECERSRKRGRGTRERKNTRKGKNVFGPELGKEARRTPRCSRGTTSLCERPA